MNMRGTRNGTQVVLELLEPALRAAIERERKRQEIEANLDQATVAALGQDALKIIAALLQAQGANLPLPPPPRPAPPPPTPPPQNSPGPDPLSPPAGQERAQESTDLDVISDVLNSLSDEDLL